MKALAINGSSRKDGNTALLLARCLETIANEGIETELVQLHEPARMKPCTACRTCYKTRDNTCVMKDDLFHEVYDKMRAADIIITGSPVYFGSATPQLMALLDRAGYVARANGDPFQRKIGGPVTVARRAGQNFTYAQLLYWYMIMGMVVPGSTYWNVSTGKAVGDVNEDLEGLETVTKFAENCAWLAQKTRA